MNIVGQKERATQNRLVNLFQSTLGYDYLGNWEERAGNRNVEGESTRAFLKRRGVDEELAHRALAQFEKAASDTSKSLYDRNRTVYQLLRYGVKVKPDFGENTQTVWLIDWANAEKNDFAIAEEVTVEARDTKSHQKRPDIVVFVNGIALAVIELKRSTVSVAEGIRQNLDNQKKVFIEHFFSTMQLLIAGNDTEGLRYGTIETPEKYYLKWKEESPAASLLDRAVLQLFEKKRFLELIHDFIVFDAGTKKLCRHNQYFGVRAAQDYIRRREGGIIWHTQGSGKSLTMVWLAKWIRENALTAAGKKDARVLIITDRKELDEQIEKVFFGVNEAIHRTRNGTDLIGVLNEHKPWLVCSLIHKFGGKEDGENVGDVKAYVEEVKRALPANFSPKGDIYVFVDECHRTQSGDLHSAMTAILPGAVFIGFTGTPLLKDDKKTSVEVFGRYIHTYKFNEAVADGVVLDLTYEARQIDQNLTNQAKVDQWFDLKTKGLTKLAKAQLKLRWGTLQKVFSSQSRLNIIVADILMDMERYDRLQSGRGNAMLVAGSIYEACKFYELFAKTPLAGKCAVITSYAPSTAEIKGEESGEGETEKLRQYAVYQSMLAEWFNEPPEKAVNRVEEFEKQAKKKFIDEPGQMKLLIVVDKLLTGFDAPPASYLYIDKKMQDHGLFQAICRVNRLDGDDKEFGQIIDYKDLFDSLKGAVNDYTSGALKGYDKEDVAGLLKARLTKAKQKLDEALETVRQLAEPVTSPKALEDYLHYFSSKDSGDADQLKDSEPRRQALYKHVAALVRAYANLANEMEDAGYTAAQAGKIHDEVAHFEAMRNEVKLHSGDAIDLKQHEPAMRHLIDSYIRADDSQVVSQFEDMSLVQLLVSKGADAVEALPQSIRRNKTAVAETIENNVRRLIINESPVNPRYYEKMSLLLDALIKQRKQDALNYAEYLKKIVELAKRAAQGPATSDYPKSVDSSAKRALFDNLGKNESLALKVDAAVRANVQDDWRSNGFKTRQVRNAIREILEATGGNEPKGTYSGEPEATEEPVPLDADAILELVKRQHEY